MESVRPKNLCHRAINLKIVEMKTGQFWAEIILDPKPEPLYRHVLNSASTRNLFCWLQVQFQ